MGSKANGIGRLFIKGEVKMVAQTQEARPAPIACLSAAPWADQRATPMYTTKILESLQMSLVLGLGPALPNPPSILVPLHASPILPHPAGLRLLLLRIPLQWVLAGRLHIFRRQSTHLLRRSRTIYQQRLIILFLLVLVGILETLPLLLTLILTQRPPLDLPLLCQCIRLPIDMRCLISLLFRLNT